MRKTDYACIISILAIFSLGFFVNYEISQLKWRLGKQKTTYTSNLDFVKLYKAAVYITDGDRFGSGAVISKDGLILTAGHIIDHPMNQVKSFGGNTYKILSAWRDDKHDVGFIRIDANDTELSYLELAEEVPPVGSSVYLAGCPYIDILFPTITHGIISFIDRDFYKWKDTIQTDAECAHGSSGSPLVNDKGQIVGICVSKISGGYGVTICESLEHIKEALEKFKEHEIGEIP